MKYFLFVLGLTLLLGSVFFLLKKEASLSFDNPFLSFGEKTKTIIPIEEEKHPVTILFGGDIQLDRYIRTVMQKRGEDFVLAPLVETLNNADLVVANLEGPITDSPSVSETSAAGEAKNYVFTFPPSSGAFLKKNNIGLVNIGNNHILNFREDGVTQTKKNLTDNHVHFFGSPLDGDRRTYIETIHGTQIAFVNYNQFVENGREKALEDLQKVREQADFTVVFTHWGKEYVEPQDYMKGLAHEFVDGGAGLVIGTHPHVVQAKEEYKGKMIYYSLGNFVFDQYFRPETQSGLLIRANFDPGIKSVSTQDIPIILKSNGQTVLRSSH